MPLVLNSGIFPASSRGNSVHFAAIEEKNGCMLSISDSCSWNLFPCTLLRSGARFTSDVVCGLVVVWHFQTIYSSFIVLVLCTHIQTLRFLPTTSTETYVYAARPSDTIISIVTAYLLCELKHKHPQRTGVK